MGTTVTSSITLIVASKPYRCLTRQVRLHSFGAVTRRKQIQSPLEALGSLYTFVIDESWICNTSTTQVNGCIGEVWRRGLVSHGAV